MSKTKNQNSTQKAFPDNIWKSYAILIIGIILTLIISYYTKKDVDKQSGNEFKLICNEINSKIKTRLYTHAQLLRSGSAFFAVSDTITRLKWRNYYDNSYLERNLPGIQGFGFSLLIPKVNLKQHTELIRGEGFPKYTVYPEGDREFYTSIIYIEPFKDRNLKAFGYDMFSEPVRRKAMEHARDYDIATLSGKVLLVQETNKDIQAGTLMYVPVYKKGLPVETIEERRAAIIGWVYSPYHMRDLMHGILGRWDLNDNNKIHMHIYDEDSISDKSLLFDSQRDDTTTLENKSIQTLTMPIEFNGKKWTLVFSQSKDQYFSYLSKVIIVIISGIVISLLLFFLSRSLINTSRKAQKIAGELTEELKESETRFSLFMDHLPAIAYLKDNEGKTLFVNKYLDKAIGASNWIGKNIFEVFPNKVGETLLADDLKVINEGYEKIEESITESDGKEHFFETRKFIIPREGQKPFIGCISLDITERKEAENAIIENAKRIKNLFDSIPISYQSLDENGCFIEVNDEWLKLMNYTREEIIGKTFSDIWTPETRHLFPERFNQFKNLCHIENTEIKLLKKNGEPVTIILTGNIQLDQESKFEKTHCIIVDITKRKEHEEELAQIRQNYETFFNTIDEFLFVLDEQGNIIHTNSTVINRLGFSEEELSGNSVLMVHPPERREEAGRIVVEMLQGISEFCPVPVITKSGIQIPVETRVTPGFWNGKPVIFGVTKDISKVRLSEEKFSKIFYLNPSACGLSNVETSQYIEVNNAFTELLGYTNEEVKGKTAIKLGILKLETIEKVLLITQETGSTRNIEAELVAKNGDIKHVLLSAEIIYVQDKQYRFTIAYDISDRKQYESLLEEKRNETQKMNEKLVQLNADKDLFISILAHDLKAPFNSILGFLSLITENIREYTIDEIEAQINIVNSAAQNTFNLLEDILVWAASQTGKIPFEPSELNLAVICNDVIENLNLNAKSKNITINYSVAENLKVVADKNMIQTVLLNLVSNAIKFTNKNGEIKITAKNNETNILVTVSDNGIGIDNDTLNILFDLKQKISTKGTANEKGTGIGLSLCKVFVEKHGGEIWVESEFGKGSNFIFSIPQNLN